MNLQKVWLFLIAAIITVVGFSVPASAGSYVSEDVFVFSDVAKVAGYPKRWSSEQDSVTAMIAQGYLLFNAAEGDSVHTQRANLLYDVTLPGYPPLKIAPDSISFVLEGGLWPNAASNVDTLAYYVGVQVSEDEDGPWTQFPNGYAKIDTAGAVPDTMVYSYDVNKREPSFTNVQRKPGGFDTGGLILGRYYRLYIKNKAAVSGDGVHTGNATLWFRITVRKHYSIN